TRPGGRVVICEFSTPTWMPFRVAYQEYLMRALPKMARLVTKDRGSYDYLAESIRSWPDQAALGRLMLDAGWKPVKYRNVSGSVADHKRGTRPTTSRRPHLASTRHLTSTQHLPPSHHLTPSHLLTPPSP